MKIYEYMIIYHNDEFNGRYCEKRYKPIKTYEDIQILDAKINKMNNLKGPFMVTHFKLLRTYRGKL